MQTEYRQRREQLMAKIGSGTAIFRSAPTAVMHNDVEYIYRQDSNFFYLTGFNEAQAVAVLAPHHPEHRFILFVQPKDREKEVWSGYRCGIDAAKEFYGADVAYPIAELDEKLPQYLEKANCIYYHLGRDRNFNDKILQHYQNLLRTYPKRGTGPTSITDPGTVLNTMRLYKSKTELDPMRQAVGIAVEAHNYALQTTAPGRYEYEIQAEIDREMIARMIQTCLNAGAGVGFSTWSAISADGRWSGERARDFYNRLVVEANRIAVRNSRGSANFIIAMRRTMV
jgi:Xaa-Pro aminopeptidase